MPWTSDNARRIPNTLDTPDAADVHRCLRSTRHQFDTVGDRRPVHIQRQHRHPTPPRIRQQQPLRIHPGVVGEQPRVEGRGVVHLEPGRLVRRHGEGDRVRLAEAVRAEGLDDLPGTRDHFWLVAPLSRQLREPDADLTLQLGFRQQPPHPVRLVPAAAGHDPQDLDDLLMEDDHSVGLAQRLGQIGVRITRGGASVPGLDEGAHHVGGDRSRPEERDIDDQIVEVGGLQPPHQITLARRFDLEAAQRLGGTDEPVRGRVAGRHLLRVVQVEAFPRRPARSQRPRAPSRTASARPAHRA